MTTTAPPLAAEPDAPAPGDGGSTARRLLHTYGWLAAPAVVGLVIRWLAVTVWYPVCEAPKSFGAKVADNCVNPNWGDLFYFKTQSELLADGHGFVNPGSNFIYVMGNKNVAEFAPGAGHPPVYTLFLALLQKLGLGAPDVQHRVFPFIGVLGIVLVGILAMRVSGGRRSVGLVAATVVATSPIFWINDFRYLSESIYIPLIAALLLVFYRFWRTPTWGWAIGLGVALGVVSLTRGEGFAILVCTLPFLLWGMRSLTAGRRLALGAVATGVMLAVMAPWIIYNLSRFDRPVYLTSGTGMVLLHGSCDDAFTGERAGYYSFTCAAKLPAVKNDPGMADEAYADDIARRQATDYLRDHAGQLPQVAVLRVLRVWGLYSPFQGVDLDDRLEGRGYAPSMIGLVYTWVLLPFAVGGAVVLRRRKVPIAPMVGLCVAVSVTAAASFGITRYRVPADVALAVLAAVGVDALVRRLRAGAGAGSRDGGASPVGDGSEPAVEPAPAISAELSSAG